MQHATSFFTERLGIPGESVHQALELQKEKGGTLVRILVRQNMVDEIELLKKLGKEMGMDQTISLPPEIQTDFTASIPIAFLKKHIMVPVAVGDDAFIAINDPFNFQALDDLRRLLGWVGVRPVLCPQAAIVSAINFAYDMTQNTAEEVMQDIDEEDPEALFSEIEETGDLLDDTSDSPVIRLVNLMFSQAVRDNASDIHIEPYQNSLKVRQRLDGILYDMLNPPKHVQSALISRIKIMANLNIA
ncbi:MAG: Flp pilus assembly complex ATPase component TadA, partial [Proteobacteria bacterium]|nr:Flp pilus assembly complex ATPase component TadA [Pseudomonadota bacterium]